MRDSATGKRGRARTGVVGLVVTVAGCGGPPEATRFVPAEAAAPDRSASAPDHARPEVRKIEMH